MRIDDNERAMIYRENGTTTLLIAKMPGCFGGEPDARWSREITDAEVQTLLDNPWVMFERVTLHTGLMSPATQEDDHATLR